MNENEERRIMKRPDGPLGSLEALNNGYPIEAVAREFEVDEEESNGSD